MLPVQFSVARTGPFLKTRKKVRACGQSRALFRCPINSFHGNYFYRWAARLAAVTSSARQETSYLTSG